MFASTSTIVHKASLVDATSHSPALLELVEQPLTRPVVDYFIDAVEETVDQALGRASPRGRSLKRRSPDSQFATLVNNVLSRAEVELPVVLTALAYLDRARPHLHIALEEWANERVFLGALIVASKYTNDSSLKNIHWAMCTGIFGKRDIGRIEREFLAVLDWELSISEADVLAHHAQLSELIPELHHSTAAEPLSPLPTLSTVSSSSASSPIPVLHHSPSSSISSLSPRTPIEMSMDIDVATTSRSQSRESSAEAAAYPAPIAHKHSHNGPFKLLRSFHFPRHHHSHPQAAAA